MASGGTRGGASWPGGDWNEQSHFAGLAGGGHHQPGRVSRPSDDAFCTHRDGHRARRTLRVARDATADDGGGCEYGGYANVRSAHGIPSPRCECKSRNDVMFPNALPRCLPQQSSDTRRHVS